MKIIIFILIFLLFPMLIFCQEKKDTSHVSRNNALRVYVDAPMFDINFIKENIKFVNYVRDSKEADLHILFSSQYTGSGGQEFTLTYEGQKKYAGMNDTLRFNTEANNTDDEKRNIAITYLKLGLMRFVAKTPLGKQIDISFQSQESNNELVVDKWKNWVFSTNIGGFFRGESSVANSNIWSSISAYRITPEWKFINSLNNNYSEVFFILDSVTHVTCINQSWSVNNLTAKSINEHWSAGGKLNVSSSTYNNYKLKTAISPSIEYNLFKYSESTRKQLRFLYSVSGVFAQYNDTTVNNKIEELLFKHSLQIAFQYIEKWGSLSLSVLGSQYFYDPKKNNVDIQGSFSIRLFKGLSIGMSGGCTFINDQLALPKKEPSIQDILLGLKQLETKYSYWNNVNLTYTFGSIYNNVVNIRFGEDY